MIKFAACLLLICLLLPVSAEEQAKAARPAAGFWHIGLVVADLDLMHKFYSGVIGLEPVTHLHVEDQRVAQTRDDSIRVTNLDALMGVENSRLELRHYSDPTHTQFLELLTFPDHPADQVERASNKPLGLGHLGLQVDSIERVLTAMSKSGLGSVAGGPVVLPEFGNNTYVYIKDPEGNLLELYEINATPQK